MSQTRMTKTDHVIVCFRHPNEMRFGVYALCPIFADEKRKADLPVSACPCKKA